MSTPSSEDRRAGSDFASRLAERDLGQVLDIVPNHMDDLRAGEPVVVRCPGQRASQPVRRSLRRGLGSARAATRPTKIVLPVLGDDYDARPGSGRAGARTRRRFVRRPLPRALLSAGAGVARGSASRRRHRALADRARTSALPAGPLARLPARAQLSPVLRRDDAHRRACRGRPRVHGHAPPDPRLVGRRFARWRARRPRRRLAAAARVPHATARLAGDRRLDRRREDPGRRRTVARRLAGRRHHGLRRARPVGWRVRRPGRRGTTERPVRRGVR